MYANHFFSINSQGVARIALSVGAQLCKLQFVNYNITSNG